MYGTLNNFYWNLTGKYGSLTLEYGTIKDIWLHNPGDYLFHVGLLFWYGNFYGVVMERDYLLNFQVLVFYNEWL